MADKSNLIDLNTASLDELTSLSGVGRAMAERIIAARPFETTQDLMRVSGIGSSLLDRIAASITVTSVEEPNQSEVEASEQAQPEIETPEDSTPSIEPESAQAEEPVPAEDLLQMEEPGLIEEEPVVQFVDSKQQTVEADLMEEVSEPLPAEKDTPATISQPEKHIRVVSPSQAAMIAVVTSLASILLSVVITLFILGSVNNGLYYASPADVASVRRYANTLENQAIEIQQDVLGMRTRIDNLESFSGRIDAAEDEIKQLNSEFTGLNEQIGQMLEQTRKLSGQMDKLAAQTQEIQAQTNRFQTFLEGLRELLDRSGEPGQ